MLVLAQVQVLVLVQMADVQVQVHVLVLVLVLVRALGTAPLLRPGPVGGGRQWVVPPPGTRWTRHGLEAPSCPPHGTEPGRVCAVAGHV